MTKKPDKEAFHEEPPDPGSLFYTPAPPPCVDCQQAARHAYSDATTPGFFYDKCEKHRIQARPEGARP